jgi:MerR family redox-sensitive transcriptional activator SoxR
VPALPKEITIGELSVRSGVAPSALRYYEQRGLIAAARTSGNQRRYRRLMLRRVAFILAAQHVGASLDEIKDALAMLPNDRTPTAADWARLSAAWRGRLDQRIDDLERLRDRLTSCIGCGCLSLRKCRLFNPDDRVAAWGSGPRLLFPNGLAGPRWSPPRHR